MPLGTGCWTWLSWPARWRRDPGEPKAMVMWWWSNDQTWVINDDFMVFIWWLMVFIGDLWGFYGMWWLHYMDVFWHLSSGNFI
jgi:hypothetical protein